MKVHLLYRDRDFDLRSALPSAAAALTSDLALEPLFDAMARGDKFLLEVAKRAVLGSLRDPRDITYRQDILRDCIANSALVQEMYALAVEAAEREKRIWGWTLNRYPDVVLRRSLEALTLFAGILRRLRRVAEEHGQAFRSEGFTALFAMLRTELREEYLQELAAHVKRLDLPDSVLLTAGLGEGNKPAGFLLSEPREDSRNVLERIQSWVGQLASSAERTSYVYQVAERDEAGLQALAEIRSRGLAAVAASLGRSSDHILNFFGALRTELGFYIGCLNLRDDLAAKGAPMSIPQAVGADELILSARGLYDAALSLRMEGRVVGNDLDADHKPLIVITGANRGGKTTFHRSLGQALLMMQCGLFVPAVSFRSTVCSAIFTHYKREEDTSLEKGKLDEEMSRMSEIVDSVKRGALVLCNESFASTNEREGSEIARQIVNALLDAGVRVAYVTHLYDLARGFYRARLATTLFLRAERLPDGQRTFRVVEGEPLPTSYGADLYGRIFEVASGSEETPGRA